MSAYRFEVDGSDVYGQPQHTTFTLDATNRADAEYEAEYCLNMFPGRHSDQTGRLYRDGVPVKELTWTAVPW